MALYVETDYWSPDDYSQDTVSINWGTSVIFVPKTFLTLVQTTPNEVYDLDINKFRLELKNLEDNVMGITYLKTNNHNTEVSLGGLTYARVVEILDPYTVTFEDGQYSVNLLGANSNIGDKVNLNQVSVRSNNSAGLISTPLIEYSSFEGAIWLDTVNGSVGTLFPIGTHLQPAKYLEDVKLIADYRGLNVVNIIGDAILNTTTNFDEFVFEGQTHVNNTVEVLPEISVINSVFRSLTVTGTLDGGNELRDCIVTDLNYVNGHIHDSGLISTIILGGNTDAILINCYTLDSVYKPFIDLGGTGQNLTMTNYNGAVTLMNLHSNNIVSIGLGAGRVILDSTTITSGIINITGGGTLVDENGKSIPTGIWNSGVTVVNNLMNNNNVSIAVWDEPIGNHLIAGSTGKSVGTQQFAGVITIDTLNGVSGTTFPTGTQRIPSNNIIDAVIIANNEGIDKIHFNSDYVFDSSINIQNFVLDGNGKQSTTFTFENGCIVANCEVHNVKVTGIGFGITGFYNSHIQDYTSYGLIPASNDVVIEECLLQGILSTPSNYSGTLNVLNSWMLPTGGLPPIFDMNNGDFSVQVRNLSGFISVRNCNNDVDFRVFFASGGIRLESTVTAGNFTFAGVGSLVDESTSWTSLDKSALIYDKIIAEAVWDEPIKNHILPDTMGHQMYHQAYDNIIHIDVINGVSGTTFPVGTTHAPSNNIEDAYTIASTHFISKFHVVGLLNLDTNVDLGGYTIGADSSVGNYLSITSYVNSSVMYFEDLTVSGSLTGGSRFTTCVMGRLTGFDGGAKNSLITGDIDIVGTGANYFTECDTYMTDLLFKNINVGSNLLNLIRCRGAFNIVNYTGNAVLALDFVAGRCKIDSSCDSGMIGVSGLAELFDESGIGCTIIDKTLTEEGTADAVWNKTLP